MKKIMKKVVLFSMPLVCLIFICQPVKAAEGGIEPVYSQEINISDISGLMDEMKDKIRDAVKELDEETTKDIFSFLKEKESEGSFTSKEGMKAAIEEGKEKFNASISEKDIEKTVQLMSQLEDLGFDLGSIIEKSEDLYEQYGSDFVDHTQELVTNTIKESAGNIVKNTVNNFFTEIWNGVKGFFAGLL